MEGETFLTAEKRKNDEFTLPDGTCKRVKAEDDTCDENFTDTEVHMSLLHLSDDVLLHIFNYCTPTDVRALSFCNRRLHILCLDRSLWKRVDMRDRRMGVKALSFYVQKLPKNSTQSLCVRGLVGRPHLCSRKGDSTSIYSPESKSDGISVKNSKCGESSSSCSASSSRQDEASSSKGNYVGSSNMEATSSRDTIGVVKESGNSSPKPFSPNYDSHSPTSAPSTSNTSDSKCPKESNSRKPMENTNDQSKTEEDWTVTRDLMTAIRKKCPDLKELRLEYCYIDCNAIQSCSFPSTLEVLSLQGSVCRNVPLSRAYLFRLHDHCPKLTDIDLSRCGWLASHSLLVLSKVSTLKRLSLRHCWGLGECVAYASLSARYGFKSLEVLDIRGTPMGDSEITAFSHIGPLRELLLQGSGVVEDSGINGILGGFPSTSPQLRNKYDNGEPLAWETADFTGLHDEWNWSSDTDEEGEPEQHKGGDGDGHNLGEAANPQAQGNDNGDPFQAIGRVHVIYVDVRRAPNNNMLRVRYGPVRRGPEQAQQEPDQEQMPPQPEIENVPPEHGQEVHGAQQVIENNAREEAHGVQQVIENNARQEAHGAQQVIENNARQEAHGVQQVIENNQELHANHPNIQHIIQRAIPEIVHLGEHNVMELAQERGAGNPIAENQNANPARQGNVGLRGGPAFLMYPNELHANRFVQQEQQDAVTHRRDVVPQLLYDFQHTMRQLENAVAKFRTTQQYERYVRRVHFFRRMLQQMYNNEPIFNTDRAIPEHPIPAQYELVRCERFIEMTCHHLERLVARAIQYPLCEVPFRINYNYIDDPHFVEGAGIHVYQQAGMRPETVEFYIQRYFGVPPAEEIDLEIENNRQQQLDEVIENRNVNADGANAAHHDGIPNIFNIDEHLNMNEPQNANHNMEGANNRNARQNNGAEGGRMVNIRNINIEIREHNVQVPLLPLGDGNRREQHIAVNRHIDDHIERMVHDEIRAMQQEQEEIRNRNRPPLPDERVRIEGPFVIRGDVMEGEGRQRRRVVHIPLQLNLREPGNANDVNYVGTSNLVTDASLLRFGFSKNIVHIGGDAQPQQQPTTRGGQLTTLVCRGYPRVTDRALTHLAVAAPNLTRLDLSYTNVTLAGAQAFRAARQDCQLIVEHVEDCE